MSDDESIPWEVVARGYVENRANLLRELREREAAINARIQNLRRAQIQIMLQQLQTILDQAIVPATPIASATAYEYALATTFEETLLLEDLINSFEYDYSEWERLHGQNDLFG